MNSFWHENTLDTSTPTLVADKFYTDYKHRLINANSRTDRAFLDSLPVTISPLALQPFQLMLITWIYKKGFHELPLRPPIQPLLTHLSHRCFFLTIKTPFMTHRECGPYRTFTGSWESNPSFFLQLGCVNVMRQRNRLPTSLITVPFIDFCRHLCDDTWNEALPCILLQFACSKWSEDWELILNPSKLEHFPVGDTFNPVTYDLASRTSPNTQPIETVNTARDLWLFLNTEFTADNNVACTIKNDV